MNNGDSSYTQKNPDNKILPAQTKEALQMGLLELLLCHRKTIIITTFLSLVAAYIYLLMATPIYTSSARLYVEQSGPKIISDYEGFLTDSKNYLFTQRELMQSTPIMASVAANPQIKRLISFQNIDNIIAYLKKNIDVSVGKKDDIITVSFDSPYPADATRIVNAIVDSYVDYHSTHKRSTVLEVLKILQKEKIKRDTELSEQTKQLLDFTRTNGMVAFDNSSFPNVAVQRLAKLSDALTEAQLATINAKAEYEVVASIKNDPAKIKQFALSQQNAVAVALAKDKESILESKIKELESNLEELRKNCTEEHPSVVAVKNNISHIKQQVEKQTKDFSDAFVQIMEQKYQSAKQAEDQLLKSFDSQQQTAQDAGIKTAEYSVISSELKRTQRLCEILDERIKQLNVAEDTGALNINILEVARVPENASKPHKAAVMTKAFLFGLLISAGLIFLHTQFDSTLHSADEISAVLGIPILGIVPTIFEEIHPHGNFQNIWQSVKSAAAKIRSSVTSHPKPIPAIAKSDTIDSTAAASTRKELHSHKTAPPTGKELNRHKSNLYNIFHRIIKSTLHRDVQTASGNLPQPALAEAGLSEESRRKMYIERGQKVRLKPKSIAAEAYRTIRTAIFFGAPKGQAKTILITSPTVGDGKSTLASNLGIAIAQSGQKTVILDCDFRRPVQHNIFDIDRQTGLSEVISGNTSLDNAIHQGPIDNLFVIPCGSDVPNPSELLNSNDFVKILNQLSAQFDRIIIDSPPVIPVTDGQILGAICDITILVLRAEKSTKKPSMLARDILISVGAHLLGTVVNDVHQRTGKYGYYDRYGYYSYGYGYYDSEHKHDTEKSSQKEYAGTT